MSRLSATATKPWPLFPLGCSPAVMFYAGASKTRPARSRRQYDSTSHWRHQLITLSHTRSWCLNTDAEPTTLAEESTTQLTDLKLNVCSAFE